MTTKTERALEAFCADLESGQAVVLIKSKITGNMEAFRPTTLINLIRHALQQNEKLASALKDITGMHCTSKAARAKQALVEHEKGE